MNNDIRFARTVFPSRWRGLHGHSDFRSLEMVNKICNKLYSAFFYYLKIISFVKRYKNRPFWYAFWLQYSKRNEFFMHTMNLPTHYYKPAYFSLLLQWISGSSLCISYSKYNMAHRLDARRPLGQSAICIWIVCHRNRTH